MKRPDLDTDTSTFSFRSEGPSYPFTSSITFPPIQDDQGPMSWDHLLVGFINVVYVTD